MVIGLLFIIICYAIDMAVETIGAVLLLTFFLWGSGVAQVLLTTFCKRKKLLCLPAVWGLVGLCLSFQPQFTDLPGVLAWNWKTRLIYWFLYYAFLSVCWVGGRLLKKVVSVYVERKIQTRMAQLRMVEER